MRIEPIHEANTNRQNNPYRLDCTGCTQTAKRASHVAFTEYLRDQYQKSKRKKLTEKRCNSVCETAAKRVTGQSATEKTVLYSEYAHHLPRRNLLSIYNASV